MGSIVIRWAMLGLLFLPGRYGRTKQRTRQIEPVELSRRVDETVQDVIDLCRVLALDDRGEGADQARAIIDDAFGRAVAADALSAGCRAAGRAARAGRRASAGNALLEQAQGWIGGDAPNALEGLDGLHVAPALALIADRGVPRADHGALGG